LIQLPLSLAKLEKSAL